MAKLAEKNAQIPTGHKHSIYKMFFSGEKSHMVVFWSLL
jgi:hypothetical protein